MDIKYLRDGRKVAVISVINKDQTVVQEIFITDNGEEIPSGEKFVVTTLFGEPKQSYLQKTVEDLEARKVTLKKDIKSLEKELKDLRELRKGHADLIKANLTTISGFSNLSDDLIKHIANILSGNVKWVCGTGKYNWFDYSLLDKTLYCWDTYYGDRKFDGVKLLNVLGKSKGDFSYRLNRYPDGSGDWIEYKFFETDQDLKHYLFNEMLARFNNNDLKLENLLAIKNMVEIPEYIYAATKEKHIEKINANFDSSVKIAKENKEKALKLIDQEFDLI